ncbi:hypothetical protein DOTSEDRAFT_68843 [Dothistroma septosporum NZE10]|uniref:Gluconokinase n=1 Tax=Dothistroma septosporum (strain NZE10 / CBS 128990) TaxID=675120 RepID=N1Q2Y3_DOTSN|nr:hypothetical protein DOTSEDRAFT_68843 [Dothistroma septosporum NZE10]
MQHTWEPINTFLHEQQLPPTPPSEPSTDLTKMTTNSANASLASSTVPSRHKHIWVITGPAGCGKTSVAEFLSQTQNLPYLEGDTFHTPANVQKMAAGQPLTDADRWDWLVTLREEALKTLSAPGTPGVIVTCSALKRKYRDVMRIASYHHSEVKVHFIFLRASEAVLMDRVKARQNHYMKDYMVHSQFESLEAPTEDESDVLAVEASGVATEVQELARGVYEQTMAVDV